ncbi:MAG: protein kinase [Planctomycetaceae bacterium]
MTVEQPESFEVGAELERNEYLTAFRAVHLSTQKTVRFTRFARSISASTAFRAAFRKDETSLSTLRHPGILPFLYRGEDDGRIFYATELYNGISLSEWLQEDRRFTWDEFTDIGWQIASALQFAHNMGMTHGRLTPESILVSADLRTQIVGFGLYRWIAAADAPDGHEESWPARARRDLMELGRLLSSIMDCVHPETTSAADERQVADMTDLIQTLNRPHLDFTARDVQGRLGNILLQVSGDSIEMIDDRKGQGLSRRSIVDELFDTPDDAVPPAPPEPGRAVTSGRWLLIALILVSLCVARLVLAWRS